MIMEEEVPPKLEEKKKEAQLLTFMA